MGLSALTFGDGAGIVEVRNRLPYIKQVDPRQHDTSDGHGEAGQRRQSCRAGRAGQDEQHAPAEPQAPQRSQGEQRSARFGQPTRVRRRASISEAHCAA